MNVSKSAPISKGVLLGASLGALLISGCAKKGEITYNGITAVRSACPAVAIPVQTGDITLFNPSSSHTEEALDVTAIMTNVRSTCDDSTDKVRTDITFDVDARRADGGAARDVTLPYFVVMMQGGTQIVSKRIGQASVHFEAGQARAHVSGRATATVDKSAATLPDSVRKLLLRKRRAGEEDAATDPLSRPEIRGPLQRATFEALVGFQLTDDQLKYNATR
ncbi:hypothetical protein ACLB0R_01805 [Sphingomonas sp. GlSt437]|uniref:hypothetical protein n=1 Tax=Sphingomonas sp. GlSt437 TaxID=3389970 RepID=UPI003A868754